MLSSTSRRALLLSGGAAALPGRVRAQSGASRPVRILVGYAAGGATDAIARLYAQHLQPILGAPVVVENKPGASEALAALPTRSATPDGSTLWIGTGAALAQGAGVRSDLPYDPLKDFSPVALVAEAEAVLFVRPESPVRSVPELIAHAKAHPGRLNYGTAGVGAGNHLATEYIMKVTGISMTHIPYRSDAEMIQAAMAGNVDFGMSIAQAGVPRVADGSLRAIAVTGPRRLKDLPDVPTLAEAGVPELRAMGSYTFYGLVGPAGLPAPVIQRLNEAFNTVSATPEVDQRMRERLLFTPTIMSPEAFQQYLRRELATWQELGKTVRVGSF